LNSCKCNADRIQCGGDDAFDLKRIFANIGLKLENDEKNFKRFILNNTAINELEGNTFFDITFNEIYIHNATQLKLVNTRALSSTNLVTKKFSVNFYYDNYSRHRRALINNSPNYYIFHFLSLFINLEVVYLCFTNIHEIPSYAFQSIN
jgi:hypothetical protein